MSRPSLALTRRAGIVQDSQDSQVSRRALWWIPESTIDAVLPIHSGRTWFPCGYSTGIVSVCTHHDAEANSDH